MLTVLLVLRHTIELGLLLVQILVAILVGRNVRRRSDHFGSGFYTIFFCRIVCDVVVFILTFTYTRLTTYNIVPARLLGQPPSPVVFSFVIAIFIYSQELFHTLIAVNRFVTFRFPVLQSKFNSRKYAWSAVVAVMIVTVSLSFPRLFGQLVLMETGDGFSVINIDKANYVISNNISIATVLLTTVSSLVLELRSYVLYRQWSSTRKKIFVNDFGLLVCSMLQLSSQVILSMAYVFSMIASMAAPYLSRYAAAAYPYTNDLTSLTSGLCLLVTSKSFRDEFTRFYRLSHLRLKKQPATVAVIHSARTSTGWVQK